MAVAGDKRCGPDTHSSLLPLQHTSSIPGISLFKGEKKGYNITSFRLREIAVRVTGWRDSCHSLFEIFPDLGFTGSQDLSVVSRGDENPPGLVEAVWGGVTGFHL